MASAKPTLYDMPVSNNGARVRLVMYWKGLEADVDIKSPMELGGLKDDRYLALNPQGKMPLLVLENGTALPESEVISQYVLHRFQGTGPDLVPAEPEERAVAALLTRLHDTYVTSIQGVLYKGGFEAAQRAETLAELVKQLDVIESTCRCAPYLAGASPSFADAAVFPTMIFVDYIGTTVFGWDSAFNGRPKLAAWYDMMKEDACGARVYEEVSGGLKKWSENDRWDKLGITEQLKDASYTWKY